MSAGTPIDALVPHAGSMVLLRAVVSAEGARVTCRADSHRDPANPLLRDGMLSVLAGIEYGAQAAAVHGALTRGAARSGFLAGVRDLTCSVDRLDRIESDLLVTAECEMVDPAAMLYRFSVAEDAADGPRPLVSGRLTIKLTAEATP